MATFEVRGPDGSVYDVEAPDEKSALAALGTIGTQRPQQPAMSWADTGIDVAKGAGVGAAEGMIGTVGLPGDIRAGMSAATDAIGQRLGASPETIGQIKSVGQRIGSVLPFGLGSIATGPTSEQIKGVVEGQTGAFYEPKGIPGQYARTVGQNAVNALVPGGVALRTASVLAPALASETAGQAFKGKPSEGAARVAAALAAGGAVGVGGAIHNARRSLIPNMSGPSSRALESAVPPGAERRLAELGNDAMLLDASPATRQWAQGVGSKDGPGMSTVVDALTARNQGANARLMGELDSTLGPTVEPAAFHRLIDSQLADLQPLYQQVTSVNQPVYLQHVVDQIRQHIPQESGRVQSSLQRVMDWIAPRQPGANGQRIVRSAPNEVHNLRMAIDTEINEALKEAPRAQGILGQYRRAIDEALADAVPDIKVLDQTHQNLLRTRDAYASGGRIFDVGKEAIRPATLIEERQAMGAPQQVAQRMGARTELDRVVGTRANDLEALRKSVMSEGDFNPTKMAEVFGAEETRRIMGAVDRERAFRDSYNKIVENSQTAQRTAAQQALNLETPNVGDLRGATLTGLALAGAKKGVDALRGQRDTLRADRMSRELGEAFTSTGLTRDDLLIAIRDAQRRRSKTNNATRDTLVRALAAANAARGH